MPEILLKEFLAFLMLLIADIEKWNTCVPFLTWSHLRSLLHVTNTEAREWYLKETVNQGWRVRTLDRNISDFLIIRIRKYDTGSYSGANLFLRKK